MDKLYNGPRTPMTFGVISVTKVLFHTVCFVTVFVQHHHNASAETRPLSQAPEAPVANKATVYIDIPSWENRTAYPRFLLYRDHLRRNLENSHGSSENSEYPNFSKPADKSENYNNGSNDEIISSLKSSESQETDKNIDDSSLEQLLTERQQQERQHNNANANQHSNDLPNEFTSQTVHNFGSTQTGHEKHVINFPKDKTNPCNRLQITPDEEAETKKNATSAENVSSSEDVSIELSNRQNFPSVTSSSNIQPEADDETEADLIRNAVPTFDLTIKIIEQSRWNEENAVFSPLSIASVLSMLMLGAGGETWKELSKQLDKHDNKGLSSSYSSLGDMSRYHESFKGLLLYLRKFSGNGVLLNSASEVFVEKNFPISKSYQQNLMNFYGAPLESINFGADGYSFMERLNKWVREKTQNQIQTILEEPPPATTTMGIINAIYFKGPWETPFNDKLTRWRDFRVQPGEKIKSKMMINILKIPYVERDTYRMAAVPYKGNETALFLILPKGSDGINDLKNVEKVLTRYELNQSLALMNETKLALTLPKLKFSSDGEMERILRNMGLSSIFHKANFSGISSEKGLYISRLLHRAVVEINEKGTEASAVSLGTADRIIDDLPIPFGCDKPFLFFIYHVKADTILFWGRVIRPENEQHVS